jgi:hypothetical protein
MQASIKTQKNGTVVAVFDAEAARTTFACVIFAARLHGEISPLARIVERQLQIEGAGTLTEEVGYAGHSSGTR